VFAVSSNQTLDQRRFSNLLVRILKHLEAYPWWANNGDDNWWSLLGCPIDHWYMQSFLGHLNTAFSKYSSVISNNTSVERLAIFSARLLPDIVNAFGLLPFFWGTPFFLAFFLSALFPE
jgi:hypothetical protein